MSEEPAKLRVVVEMTTELRRSAVAALLEQVPWVDVVADGADLVLVDHPSEAPGTVVVDMGDSPGAVRSLVRSLVQPRPGTKVRALGEAGRSRSAALTAAELEVLRLLASGLRGRAIAEKLGISTSAVRDRRERAYRKLGITSEAAAIAEAARRGHLP